MEITSKNSYVDENSGAILFRRPPEAIELEELKSEVSNLECKVKTLEDTVETLIDLLEVKANVRKIK